MPTLWELGGGGGANNLKRDRSAKSTETVSAKTVLWPQLIKVQTRADAILHRHFRGNAP